MGERVYKKKGRMKESDIFIEVDCFQKNKAGNIVCGDSYMSQKLKEEDRIISVLSDGLGSGIKASVLSAMTATMAMNYTAMNESILQTALNLQTIDLLYFDGAWNFIDGFSFYQSCRR